MNAEISARPRSRALLDLARAGNLPSVASNVVAALGLSALAAPAWNAPGTIVVALLAGFLVYAGGATFNDVADAAFDAKHRPERVIPRGVISRRAAAWAGGVELGLGSLLFVTAGASVAAVGLLIAVILLNDWLHKRWAGAVLLMAGCRTALAVAVASLPGHVPGTVFWIWAAVVFVYIAGITVLARREYRGGGEAARSGRTIGLLLALLPLLDTVALGLVSEWVAAALCLLAIPLGQAAQRLAAST